MRHSFPVSTAHDPVRPDLRFLGLLRGKFHAIVLPLIWKCLSAPDPMPG
jgi:hypothetical protein